MKKSYLLVFLIPVSFACNSSFKNMQTPDDVYYSPAVMRVDNNHHDNTNDRSMSDGPSTIINNSNNAYYNDNYYLNRRRRYYYKQAEIAENKKVIAAQRTTNLGAYNNNKSSTPVNPKISGIPATPTSNGHQPVRTFKKSNGSALGNAIRKMVSSDLGVSNNQGHIISNNNNQSSSAPAQAKTSTSTSTSARTFGKKN